MSNQPTAKIRDGAITATIWANTSDKGTRYSVDLIRSYKDDNGDWKDTTSFLGGDILRASNVLTLAYNRILDLIAENKNS